MTDEKLHIGTKLKGQIEDLQDMIDWLDSFHELVLSNKDDRKKIRLYRRFKGSKTLFEVALPDCVRVEVKKCILQELDKLRKEYEEL